MISVGGGGGLGLADVTLSNQPSRQKFLSSAFCGLVLFSFRSVS